jgi:hypothetical protein
MSAASSISFPLPRPAERHPHSRRAASLSTRVRGSRLSEDLSLLERHCGGSQVESLIACLSPDEAAPLQAVDDGDWYPVELHDHLLRVASAGGRFELLHRLGRQRARRLLEGPLRSLVRSKDAEAVLAALVPIHRSQYDPGKMMVARLEPGVWQITVSQPRSSLERCRVARAFYAEVAESCGHEGSLIEVSCSALGADACRYELGR